MQLLPKTCTPRTLSGFLLPLSVLLATLLLAACGGNPPDNLGIRDGLFPACPEKPNCVNSQSNSQDHRIDPFIYQGTPEQAHQRLLAVLQTVGGNVIPQDDGKQIHAVFTTPLLRFRDDMQFLIQPGVIHIKSASRVGYSDLGANRKRVETLRAAFEPCCNESPLKP
jgi:uncharacterized protein (DUF1499 family)